MLKVYIPVESCYNTYTGHIDMQCGMCRQLRNWFQYKFLQQQNSELLFFELSNNKTQISQSKV